MIEPDVNVQRAAKALRAGVMAAPGDLDHPAYQELEALVAGALSDIDREIVESHIALCAQCSEDVADLSAMRQSIAGQTAAMSRKWHGPAIAAGIAASLAVAIWLGRLPAAPPPAPREAPASEASMPPATQDSLSQEERGAVERAIAAGRIDVPAIVRSLRTEPSTLLGEPSGAALRPIGPVGTAVSSTRPTFRWQPVAGARAYSVAVFNDRFTEVARAVRINGTSWTPDADLPRDQELAWQVTAHRDGSDIIGPAPPQPEARFRIADEATAEQARQLSVRLAARPLQRGILLGRLGLLDEARDRLGEAAADPQTAPDAQRLLKALDRR